ncbi:hypothetical protein EB155_06450, partial [archaeon]|nr:hypothetical protein [archaeon]
LVSKEFTISLNDIIAEAIPSTENLKMLPQPTNSFISTLKSSVLEGRQASFSIEEGPQYGTLTLNEISGSIEYTTQHQDVAQEKIIFRVSDGVVSDGVAILTINLNTDPLYKHQWHLDNRGQTNFASTPGVAENDLNTINSVISGYTGNGITVSVMDEGLEIWHEDLYPNIIPDKSYNFITGSYDPTSYNYDGDHGTSVAGIIASRGWNNVGGRGVAPNAGLVGYNILEYFTYYNEAWSWGLDNDLAINNSIFNMSYGQRLYYDDNTTFEFPTFNDLNPFEEEGLINGITNLRNGKGGIYVKSMGNDFRSNRTNGFACGEEGVDPSGSMACSIRFHDATHTTPYIIGVGSLSAKGEKSSYSTTDPSIWVSGFGGEFGVNEEFFGSGYASHVYEPAITTTDQSSCFYGYSGIFGRMYNEFNDPYTATPGNEECNYVSTFNGTSSAAPSVAGSIAMLLEANPNLTWRDVKHIIAKSSKIVDQDRTYIRNGIIQYSWQTNAAGFNYHPWYGFGVFDIENAISTASSYIANSMGEFIDYGWLSSESDSGESLNLEIPSLAQVSDSISYSVESKNNFVEFIQLKISLQKEIPRDLGFTLTSPQGTVMNIIQPFTNVEGDPSGGWFIVGVSGFYGENLVGDWTINIVDYTGGEEPDTGTLIDWSIKIYGN